MGTLQDLIDEARTEANKADDPHDYWQVRYETLCDVKRSFVLTDEERGVVLAALDDEATRLEDQLLDGDRDDEERAGIQKQVDLLTAAYRKLEGTN